NGSEGNKIRVNSPGEYRVTHVNIYLCEYTSDPLNIKNFPSPQPEIIASGPLELCSNESLTLSSTIDYNIRWNTGETSKSINPRQSGHYYLTARNEFGCEGVSETLPVTIKPEASKPSVSILGSSTFCDKDSTILMATNTENLRWNN